MVVIKHCSRRIQFVFLKHFYRAFSVDHVLFKNQRSRWIQEVGIIPYSFQINRIFSFLSSGNSRSTLIAQNAGEACYNIYAKEGKLCCLRESQRNDFCSIKFHEEFAYWMVYDHVRSTTKSTLSNVTIQSYVGIILTIGKLQLFKDDWPSRCFQRLPTR